MVNIYKKVGSIAFVFISNPDLMRHNYQHALIVYFVMGSLI